MAGGAQEDRQAVMRVKGERTRAMMTTTMRPVPASWPK